MIKDFRSCKLLVINLPRQAMIKQSPSKRQIWSMLGIKIKIRNKHSVTSELSY